MALGKMAALLEVRLEQSYENNRRNFMIETTGARIFFGIWILIEIGLISGLVAKVYNNVGILISCLSAIFTGYLLYTQNWPIFFWYTLIAVIVAPLLPFKKANPYIPLKPLTFVGYVLTIAFTYLICFGTYGIIYMLNK